MTATSSAATMPPTRSSEFAFILVNRDAGCGCGYGREVFLA